MLQKVAVSLPQLGAPGKPPGSVSPEQMDWATAQVDLFFGSFRKADADEQPAKSAPKPEAATPKIEAPPPAATRPREAEPAKKKGKKGDGEP